MSNLEDLVPPLGLCRKIPEGKFAESFAHWAFVWAKDGFNLDGEPVIGWWQIITDHDFIIQKERPADDIRKGIVEMWCGGCGGRTVICREIHPAPTLHEIISDFDKVTELHFYPYLPKIWEITLKMPDNRHWHIAQHEFKRETQNAAGIALMLWLDVNKSVKSELKSKEE